MTETDRFSVDCIACRPEPGGSVMDGQQPLVAQPVEA